jgi:hypothetical protein
MKGLMGKEQTARNIIASSVSLIKLPKRPSDFQ